MYSTRRVLRTYIHVLHSTCEITELQLTSHQVVVVIVQTNVLLGINRGVVNRVSTPNKESERASVKILYLANILSLRHHMYMYMYMYLEL
jgi:hypothetical protein